MAKKAQFKFQNGLNTAAAPEELAPGELQQAVGVYYRTGDSERAWSIPGRTAFGDTGIDYSVEGVVLAQFDPGNTDRLLAFCSGTVYSASPGDTGSFSALYSGLTASASLYGGIQYNDYWFLYNGEDANRVLNGSGTVMLHGMISPQEQPVVSGVGTGSTARPTGGAGTGWLDIGNAYDSSIETFAVGSLGPLDSPDNINVTVSGWASNTDAGRKLNIVYRVAGFTPPMEGGDTEYTFGGAGGSWSSNYQVNVTITYSTDGGSNWTQLRTKNYTAAMGQKETLQVSVDDAVNSSGVQVRTRLEYQVGNQTASLQLYDVRIGTAAGTGETTTENHLYYAITEYDESTGWESPIGPVSEQFICSGTAGIYVDMPTAAQNSNTTHYRVWRTPDGGTQPDDLGRVGEILVTETNFLDDFSTWGITTQPRPVIDLLQIEQQSGDILRVPRNTKAPVCKHLNVFKGSLVGIDADLNVIRYSEPGMPQSWPEIYVLEGFPWTEKDDPIATMTVGNTLLIFGSDNVAHTKELPLIINGQFDASDIDPLKGQPGLVGPKALTTMSVHGEAVAAWVSRFGIHFTNGETSTRITDELDWESTVNQATLSSAVLFWDKEHHLLFFAYDSSGDGNNDRYLTFHMNSKQRKQSGMPKITGPHYGKLSALTGGFVDNLYKMYSAHPSDGKVYREWSGISDASNAYDAAGTIPIVLETGEIYGNSEYLHLVQLSMRTTNFGTGQTATLTTTAGKDNSPSTSSVSKSVDLSRARGKEVFVNRAGEWFKFKLQKSTNGSGAVNDLRAKIIGYGDSGDLEK